VAGRIYSIKIAEASFEHGVITLSVPIGFKWIVRDIDVIERSLVGSQQFGALGNLGQFYAFFTSPAAPELTPFHWEGRQVFNQGDTLQFQALGGYWDLSCSGYQLTAT
jgi:hypothetical protein